MRGSTPVLTLRQSGGEDVQSSVDVAVVNRSATRALPFPNRQLFFAVVVAAG
jgi:hypothetical protein